MSDSWDVVVAGAGIHGAGVAQAAAAAGHSVLVLEQRAVAAGSSSRSSKLIHGGLRYLESGQYRLVRESLRERALLLRLAPELVRLQDFYVPIYERSRRRPWQLRAGLAIYALLAGLDAAARFGTVPRSEWGRLDGLDTRGLQQVFHYHDAQTDDALLTAAVVRSAQSLGARLELPACCIGASLDRDGVQVRYITGGSDGDGGGGSRRSGGGATEHECRARVFVNAAGPWAEKLARTITPALAIPALELVRGTHLLLDGPPQAGVYYLENPHDGRAIFSMPWRDQLLLGTTEVRFRGDPATVAPTEQETEYLLAVLRHYFPGHARGAAAQPHGAFAGLRVLPARGGRVFNRSRETLLDTDRARQPRVLTIYGGKLTTWRAVAAKIMARISPSLPQRRALARTDELELRPS